MQAMASNSTRGKGKRAMFRCSDADLYGGVNEVGSEDSVKNEFYSKEIHVDAVKIRYKKGPNKLRPHKDEMMRAAGIRTGSDGGMKTGISDSIVHPSPAVTQEVIQK